MDSLQRDQVQGRQGATADDAIGFKTMAGPYWITVGLDQNYAYVSSGDVIDTKTRKIVATLKDEFGRRLLSEKVLDMTFIEGKAQRISNAFGNGYLDTPNLPFTPPPPPIKLY